MSITVNVTLAYCRKQLIRRCTLTPIVILVFTTIMSIHVSSTRSDRFSEVNALCMTNDIGLVE